MNSEEAIHFLNELERTLPVGSWTEDGVHLWPLVRGELWWELNDNYRDSRVRLLSARPVRRRMRQLVERPAAIMRWAPTQLRDRARGASSRRRSDAVLLGDSVSRIPIDDVWFDRHTDPMVDALAEIGLGSLQLDLHHVYRRPQHRPSVHVQPRIDGLWVLNRLARPNPSPAPEGFDELRARVRGLGRELPTIGFSAVTRQARFVASVANWFDRVLERTGARIGVLVDNGPVHAAFNLACARRGIPALEIQHGVQLGNARYTRWSSLSPGGYPELPSHFWVWSEQEAANIRAWANGCDRHQPVVGGNLWLQRWKEGTAPNAAAFDAQIRAMASTGHGAVNVIVTLSTDTDTATHLRGLRDAVAAAPEGWHWWIRSHPTMREATFRWAMSFLSPLGSSKVFGTRAHELPLYALLGRADVHLTQVSSVVLDARAFGIPSVVTDRVSLPLFAAEFDSGWAVLATGGEEILAGIERQIHRRSALSSQAQEQPLAPQLLLGRILAGDQFSARPHGLTPSRTEAHGPSTAAADDSP